MILVVYAVAVAVVLVLVLVLVLVVGFSSFMAKMRRTQSIRRQSLSHHDTRRREKEGELRNGSHKHCKNACLLASRTKKSHHE